MRRLNLTKMLEKKKRAYLRSKLKGTLNKNKKVVLMHLMKGWFSQKLEGTLYNKNLKVILQNNTVQIKISLDKYNPLLGYIYNV